MATVTKSPGVKLVKPPAKNAVKATAPAEAEVEQKTPSKAVKSVTKAKPATKADPVPAPEVEVEDIIVSTAKEIETMKADKAFHLVPKLLDSIDHDFFRLGGVLALIQTQNWCMDHGHETFRSYVESECGLQYRKAMYLIEIYNGLVESGVAWDKVRHLGWTKLKELARILSPENVDDWVAVAEQLTVLQLIDHIKEATKGENAANSPEVVGEKSKTTTMTFKLHEDQKETVREALDKAKHESGTEFDSVALEAIALDFLGGESKLKSMPSLKELMEGKSVEEVLTVFEEVFPDVTLEATVPDSED